MDDNEDKSFQIRDQEAERRARLANLTQSTSTYNPAYSTFIRRAKLILPIIALCITAIIFTWNTLGNDNIIPAKDKATLAQSIGQNELLSPRFESTDEKKQPYTITASRAVQPDANEDLILLEKPVGDMLLNNGNAVSIEAVHGVFKQKAQHLLLKEDVRLFHDQGYQMKTQILNIDLDKSTAWSDQKIYAQGPKGTLESEGLNGNLSSETLVFTGPIKLIINRSVSEFE